MIDGVITNGCSREGNGIYKGFEKNFFGKGNCEVIAFDGGAQVSNLLNEALKHNVLVFGKVSKDREEKGKAIDEIHGEFGEKGSFVPFNDVMEDGNKNVIFKLVENMLNAIREKQQDRINENQR